jgi:hypothetical protein
VSSVIYVEVSASIGCSVNYKAETLMSQTMGFIIIYFLILIKLLNFIGVIQLELLALDTV